MHSSHYHQQEHPSYSSAGPYSDSNYPQHRPPPPPPSSSSSAPSYPSGSSSQDYAFSGAQYSQPSSSSSSSSYYSGGAAYNKDPYYNTEHHGGSASTGSASRAEDMNQSRCSFLLHARVRRNAARDLPRSPLACSNSINNAVGRIVGSRGDTRSPRARMSSLRCGRAYLCTS